MDDENNNQTVENGKNVSQELANKATQKVTQKMAKETGKKMAAKASLMGPLGHIIAIAAPILIIIIILGGIILFLLTAPGLVIENLKKLAKEIADGLFSWFGGDKTTLVDDEKIFQTLDYLEEMGYDLKGYGFLTDYMTQEDYNETVEEEAKKGSEARQLNLDEDVGVVRDESDKIANAKSEYVIAYLISDNYVYTLANKNAVTQSKNGGFWSKVWGGIKAVRLHIWDFFGGETPNSWTRGLLNIYEEGSGIGVRGGFYSDTGFLNFNNMEIDVANKKLNLKKSSLTNRNGTMQYSLDGWTGRYGMPLEFLLSIHVATMMPDLAYDMASTFNTKVNLLLHQITEADANSAFKVGDDKYITYQDIDDICGGFVDSWFVSSKEAMEVLKKLGIKSPDNCTGAHKEGYGTEDIEKVNIWGDYYSYYDDNYNNAKEKYKEALEKMKEYGYSGGSVPDSISSYNQFDSQLQDCTEEANEIAPAGAEKEYFYTGDITISWIGKNENGESCTYYGTITITHGKVKDYGTQVGEEFFNFEGVKITRDFSQEEWDSEIEKAKEEKEKNGEDVSKMTDAEILGTMKCSESTDEFTECCNNCKKYIKRIYDELKKPHDADFDYYIPYIENVTDHWYRDVYFTETHYDSKGNKDGKTMNFVDYDYDYEAVMKERWTKYETDSETGEYKLYAINKNGDYATSTSEIENYKSNLFEEENGYYIFKGTQDQANDYEIVVSKKAETLTPSDEEKLEDLGWSKNDGSGLWTAYEEGGETVTDWEQIYPDDEDEIRRNIYAKITSKTSLKQVGEGQRAETNNKIKKMFLNNKYLKYDGTPERAEKITELRKDNNLGYTALSEDSLKNENISKYASKVSLNQDSLNAFSMLENMHTLDADYIYRDFKELIVELGYFTKEELTDETPRMLQWIVPDIGSGGYPNRAIDKNENEFGTMVHSKGDIDANEKKTILAKLQDFLEQEQEHKSKEPSPSDPVQSLTAGLSTFSTSNSVNLLDTVGELDGDVDPSQVSVEEFLEKAGEVHARMEGNFWEYCAAGTHSGSSARHTADGSCPGNYATYEDSNNAGKTADCSSYVSWVLQEVGIIKAKYATSEMYTALAEYILTKEEAGELQAGDIVLSDGHVQINGENNMQYNAGSTDAIQGPPKEYFPDFYTHVIRLPFNGTKKSEGEPYEGYKGNEAVVSPVTGILLDYGTYDDNDKSSITGEKYRQNVDLKYQKTTEENEPGNGDPNQNSTSNINPEYDPEKPDKVGYAKILVLDAENYKKLEAKTENPWKNDSLVNISKRTNNEGKEVNKVNYKESNVDGWILDKEERLSDRDENKNTEDPWTEIAKTVYGYKEFAESYEMGGISGYVVYIDGFKCEKPDEDFTEEQYETEIPNAGKNKADVEITKESFKKVKPSDLQVTEPLEEDKVMPSLYEQDETHKMASKKATEKAQAEVAVKGQANSTIYLEDEDLIFIKEGTLLGRTITDFELIESSEYRNETGGYEKYRKKNDSGTVTEPTTEPTTEPGNNNDNDKDKNLDPIIGNYLRIILRDTDDTVVENVEDYMKLDDGSAKMQELDDEKFLYWMGIYIEGGELSSDGKKSIAKDLGDGAGATHYFGLTHYNLELAKKLGYNISNWGDDQDLEMLVDVYLALIEEQKAQIKEELGENIEDGYLQAFISILHNYGNLTKRGDEYKSTGKVSESTWTTYEGTKFADALTKRRIGEWMIITEGKYMNSYEGNTQEIDFTGGGKYSPETPFTDWCKEHGITNIEVKKAED